MALIKNNTRMIDGQVTPEMLSAGGVTTAKIANDAVTTTKIDNSAVTSAKIADDAVTTTKIDNSAVTSAKIADSNVTKAKIENVANMKVLGNTSGSATAPQEVSILDQDDMSSNSATALATQQSIKTYVDNQLGNTAVETTKTTFTRTSVLSSVDRYTAGFATIGSIPAGVYGVYTKYEYKNNQFNNLTGEFRIKIGNETYLDRVIPGTGNTWGSSSTSTLLPDWTVHDIAGGDVVLEAKRQSTYGGSATVQIRNFTIKFLKLG